MSRLPIRSSSLSRDETAPMPEPAEERVEQAGKLSAAERALIGRTLRAYNSYFNHFVEWMDRFTCQLLDNREDISLSNIEGKFKELVDNTNIYEFNRATYEVLEKYSDVEAGDIDKIAEDLSEKTRRSASAIYSSVVYLYHYKNNPSNITDLDLDFREKLRLAADFSSRNSEEETLDYLAALFPDLHYDGKASSGSLREANDVHVAGGSGAPNERPSLPSVAPEIYQGLRGPETPPEFIKRVYEPWLGHGLDRGHIRQLDPKLYTAINNWLSRPDNVWPEDVDLPTREEQNRRMIDQLRAEAPDGQVGKVLGDFTAREAGRIRSVMQRHRK